MRIVISGGGTAGHVYPGLALADALKTQDPRTEILFIGIRKGLETELVPKAGWSLEVLDLQRFQRKIAISNLSASVLLLRAFGRSLRILKDFQPDVVVGFGGFVSVPTIAAASRLKVPIVLHEANVCPGMANRVLAIKASIIAISFPETADHFSRSKKVVLTGMPVRSHIGTNQRQEAARKLGIDPGVKTVLFFGGSLGAKAINQAVIDALPLFATLSPLQIIHLTGMIDFEQTKAQSEAINNLDEQVIYHCLAYLDGMDLAYAASDLIVARAGASTVAEITTREIPSILVPYPFATSGHQEMNARSLECRGAARVLLNKDLNGQSLVKEIKDLLDDKQAFDEMKKALKKVSHAGAANKLARLVLDTASENEQSS